MKAILQIVLLLAALVPCLGQPVPHTRATLWLDADQASPGDAVMAAVRLEMEDKWHTYWKNPGASGMATQIKWTLPEGVTAGEIRWPIPEKLFDEEFTTYVYSREVLLLVPLSLSKDLAPGALKLAAEVSWLECEVACVPGDTKVQATLAVGAERKPSSKASIIQRWLDELPKDGAFLNPVVAWDAPASGDRRPFTLRWSTTTAADSVDFFPYASEQFEVLAATEVLPVAADKAGIRKSVKKIDEWPSAISGLIIATVNGKPQAYEISAPFGGGAVGASAPASAVAGSPRSLWLMLLYAFIGGLILNIMPCVLPVIALKILGFVGQSKDSPGRIKMLGLLYALGVLVSFLALAGMVLAVKAAGHSAGWGMQFSNPQFLIILTAVITLVALNLFGLFEVTPGGRVMGAAGTLASRHGTAGAFFNGVLATVLATPCTAPFLGVALGFAFAQSAMVIVLVFTAVAAGLAFPYLVLSFNPAWLRFLPKPGAWMERFKIAMGFPMLATAVWLFSLIPVHYGDRSWWLGIFLVVLALAAWVFGEFLQKGERRRGLAAAVILGLLGLGYFFVLETQLDWRNPQAAGTTATLQHSPEGIPWEPWSPEAVAAARKAGRPVLVDFTAKWCLTCNTIVKPALESASVREKLKAVNALALLADYTLFPKHMTEEIQRWGRAGVPLVLVFPADPSQPAVVLPEALTPSMVVNALDKVTHISSAR